MRSGTVRWPGCQRQLMGPWFVSTHGYAPAMAIRLHRLTSCLGAELSDLTPAHLQALCDLRMPEDDLVSKYRPLICMEARATVGMMAPMPAWTGG